MNDKKKSKNKSGAMIKNYMTDIRNAELIAAKEKTKLRCKCSHTDENGKTLLYRSDNKKSEFTGNPLFVCRLCGAYLDIGELTEEDLASAIDKVACASEIIKMRLRPDINEDDEAAFKSVWKTEYFLKDKFPDLFKAARRRNTKKRNGHATGGGFIAGRPMSR